MTTDVTFEGYVHRAGRELHDGLGRPLTMRGVGLGNWLLPEGYMWRFPAGVAQSPREIEALVESLVGRLDATAFWRAFQEQFVTEADIRQVAEFGFDHVRLPLLGRRMISDDGTLLEVGFRPVDRLIDWCRQHRLWVVLDLHGAPGGQTGTNIDDSPRGLPDLFVTGGRYRDLTLRLWGAIAHRYRNETVVAAYDLLNEPLPPPYADRHLRDLRSLYGDLTATIRAADPHHLITYEGTRWSTDWAVFDGLPDANAMLQFHKYWSPPTLESLGHYLSIRDRLQVPIYMGEGGENTASWLQAAFGLYEDQDISWNLWPWKKMETFSSPISVRAPAGWDAVVGHARGSGSRLERAQGQAILAELLENLALERCVQRPEIVASVFRRVPFALAPGANLQGPGQPRLQPPLGAGAYDYVDRDLSKQPADAVVLPAGATASYRVAVNGSGQLRAIGSEALAHLWVDGAPAQVERTTSGVTATARVEPPSALLSVRAKDRDLVLGPIMLTLSNRDRAGSGPQSGS